MPEALHIVTVVIFTVNFLLALLLRHYLTPVAIFALLYFVAFSTSDFSGVPPSVEIYYHVWSLSLAMVSALAGYYFGAALQVDRTIRLQFRMETPTRRANLPTVMSSLFVLAVVTTAFGINAWAGRTKVLSAGLYPFGVDLVKAGIIATIVGAGVMALATIVLATTADPQAKLSVKYLWLSMIPPTPLVLGAFGNYVWYWQLATALGFVAGWAIFFVLAVYVAAGKNTQKDPFHRNHVYAGYVIGFAAFAAVLVWVIVYAVGVWTSGSLESGMIAAVASAGGMFLIALIAAFVVSDEAVNQLKAYRPVAIEMRADGQAYAVLSDRQVPLSMHRPRTLADMMKLPQ